MSSEETCESIDSCDDDEYGGYDVYEEYEECEDTEEDNSVIGLVVGLFCILLGVVLLIIGVTGLINWSFAFGGINSSLTNASPGVLLMIIGLLIIYITNHKAAMQK